MTCCGVLKDFVKISHQHFITHEKCFTVSSIYRFCKYCNSKYNAICFVSDSLSHVLYPMAISMINVLLYTMAISMINVLIYPMAISMINVLIYPMAITMINVLIYPMAITMINVLLFPTVTNKKHCKYICIVFRVCFLEAQYLTELLPRKPFHNCTLLQHL